VPPSVHQDKEMESFYKDISTTIFKIPTHFTMIVEDFNAKLGKSEMKANGIGERKYGIRERNDRGNLLLQFLLQHLLNAMNTFIKIKFYKNFDKI